MPRKISTTADAAECNAAGFRLTKLHGQHLLRNKNVIKSIIAKSAIRPSDVVLEIGPGTGNLTMELLAVARKVVAIEIDDRMVLELRKRVENSEYRDRLQIIRGDFTRIPSDKLPRFDLCVANCPYNVSSAIVFKLLLHRPMWRRSVLMFQREFALRLAAQVGSKDYSRLSVNTQLLARVEHIIKVDRNAFNPPPKVESSVVALMPVMHERDVDMAEFDGLVKLIFNRKNKSIPGVFAPNAVITDLWKIFCALNGIQMEAIEDVVVDEETSDDSEDEGASLAASMAPAAVAAMRKRNLARSSAGARQSRRLRKLHAIPKPEETVRFAAYSQFRSALENGIAVGCTAVAISRQLGFEIENGEQNPALEVSRVAMPYYAAQKRLLKLEGDVFQAAEQLFSALDALVAITGDSDQQRNMTDMKAALAALVAASKTVRDPAASVQDAYVLLTQACAAACSICRTDYEHTPLPQPSEEDLVKFAGVVDHLCFTNIFQIAESASGLDQFGECHTDAIKAAINGLVAACTERNAARVAVAEARTALDAVLAAFPAFPRDLVLVSRENGVEDMAEKNLKRQNARVCGIRAAKLAVSEVLLLLNVFLENGIHFIKFDKDGNREQFEHCD